MPAKKDCILSALADKQITHAQASVYILHEYCGLCFTAIGQQMRINGAYAHTLYLVAVVRMRRYVPQGRLF